MEELPDYSSWSTDRIHREYNCLAKMTLYTPIGGLILCFLLLFLSTGCSGTWVWQEDYPKHRITTKIMMSFITFIQLNNTNLSMSILRKNSKVAYDIIKTIIAGFACFVIHELILLW